MPRRDLSTRTRTRMTDVVELLDRSSSRPAVLGGGIVAVLALQALTADPRMAWLGAPLVLLTGLATPLRTAMTVAAVLAVGLALVDVLVVEVRPVELIGIAVRSAALPFLALVGHVGSEVERQRHRAMQRAVTEDPVTGLLNVRVFYEELAARREAREPFTIQLADLRGMRDLNDRYGHPTGTEAMRVLAHVLRRAAGGDALLARLGSDEIAVLLPGSDLDRARALVDAAVRRLAEEQVRLPGGTDFSVHASYGIARYPEDGEDEVAVLRAADRVKDRAKATGLDPVGIAGTDRPVDAGMDDEVGHA